MKNLPYELLKRKAKQLHHAFPALLTLARAQEATARCCGFKDWYSILSHAKGGERVLPSRVVPDDQRYVATMRRITFLLADEFGLPPALAHRFILGWGLHTDLLEKPFEYAYFEVERIRRMASAEELEELKIEEVADGILSMLDERHRHVYWYPSPERHAALMPAVRGNAWSYLRDEGAGLIVLSNPKEFTAKDFARASDYAARYQPLIAQWLFGMRVQSRFVDVTFDRIESTISAQPDSWFALSYRWPALPFDRNRRISTTEVLIPALRGRDYRQMIADNGALSVCEVRWFRMPMQLHLANVLARQWGPLELESMKECEAHYASPFKHGPLHEIEFTDCEGGGQGFGYVPEASSDADVHT